MSEKARKLIRRAVKEYQTGDGATSLGSFRDVITDIFHIALDDPELKEQHFNEVKMDHMGWVQFLYQWILSDGYDTFHTEREEAEHSRINQIPTKELPLHLSDSFEYDTSFELIEKRLKNEA